MSKEALIFYGGWDGHQPEVTKEILTDYLCKEGFEVTAENNLGILESSSLGQFDLIVPNWTMGQATADRFNGLLSAVEWGTGLAGFHGGMGDAFRRADNYQLMVGGQFVGHPGGDGTPYKVFIKDKKHPITNGVEDFEVESEQYYMHVDPSNHVLATTRFPVADGPHVPNGEFDMPVAWTRYYGKGNVFYLSLGHTPEILEMPPVKRMLTNGMLWAAGQLVASEVNSNDA
jgi:type 1 glutamine amidotransferase